MRNSDLAVVGIAGIIAALSYQQRQKQKAAAQEAAILAQLPDPRVYGANPIADPSIWAPGSIGGGWTGGHHH